MKAEFIGLYGGTFDPVHLGHLTAASDVQKSIDLDEVRMILSSIPPHRDQPVLSAKDRFSLLTMALKNEPKLCADSGEMERDGPSYMVDTLKGYRKEKPDCSLVLILGMEAFNGLMSWRCWEKLIDLAHIVVTDRAGFHNEMEKTLAGHFQPHLTKEKSQLKQLTHGKIYVQSVSPVAVSATDIRRRIANKEPVRHMLTNGCWEMMQENGFYTH